MKIVGYCSLVDDRDTSAAEACIANYAKETGGEVVSFYVDRAGGGIRYNIGLAFQKTLRVGGRLAVVAEDGGEALDGLLAMLARWRSDRVTVCATPNRPELTPSPHSLIPVSVGKRSKTGSIKRRISRAAPKRRGTLVAKAQRDAEVLPVYREAWGAVVAMKEGGSLRKMAAHLNSLGIQTPKGGDWTPIQVSRLVGRGERGELD